MWEVDFAGRAKKDAKKLQRDVFLLVAEAIENLKMDPFDSKKPEGLEGIYSRRVGNLRIIFSIDKESRRIRILKIGKRENVYLGY